MLTAFLPESFARFWLQGKEANAGAYAFCTSGSLVNSENKVWEVKQGLGREGFSMSRLEDDLPATALCTNPHLYVALFA